MKNGKIVGRQKRIEHAKRKTMHCRSGKELWILQPINQMFVQSKAIHDIILAEFSEL